MSDEIGALTHVISESEWDEEWNGMVIGRAKSRRKAAVIVDAMRRDDVYQQM